MIELAITNPPRQTRSQPIKTLRLVFCGRETFRIEPGSRQIIFLTKDWKVLAPDGDVIAVMEDIRIGERWIQRIGSTPQDIDESLKYVPVKKGI